MKSRTTEHEASRGGGTRESRELKQLYSASIHAASASTSRLRHGASDGSDTTTAASDHAHPTAPGRAHRQRGQDGPGEAHVEEAHPRRGGGHAAAAGSHSEIPSSAGSSRRSSGDDAHGDAATSAAAASRRHAHAQQPRAPAAAPVPVNGPVSASKRGRGGAARGGAAGARGGRRRRRTDADDSDNSPDQSESDVESSSSRKKKARRDPSVAPVAASSAAPATGRRSRRGDDQGESSSAGPSAPSALSAAADFAPETIMHPKIRPRPIDVKKEMRLGYFEDADPVQRLEYYTFQDANSASAAPGLERSREITCPNFKDVPDFEELNRDRRYLARETQRFCPYHPPADDEFVDYDADADDVAFLESLPGNAGRKKVTELVFEQLIDTFERASYDFTTFLNDPASIRFQRDAAAKKEEAQRSPQTPQCQVCNDNENHDGNIVVVCSKCNVPVHQSCYGISEDIDRNQPWVCDRCALPDPDKVSCAMCSVKTGAFKETTTPGEYAHVLCALWFPEARFVNPERMQPIEINQRAFQRRKRLGSCCVCGKAEGVCLQCCEKPCPEAFHAMCARLKGLLLTMTEREEGQNQVLFRAFCEKHTNERKAAEPREAVPQRTRMGEPVSLFMARQIATTMLQNRQVSLPPGSVQAIYEYWVRKRQAQACSFLRRFQPCKAFQYLPGEKRGQTVRSWTSKLNDMDPHAPPLRNAAGRFVSANADGRSPTPQSFTRRGRGQQLHTGDEDDSKPPAPRGRRRAAAAEGAEGQEPSPGVEGPDDEDEGAVAASPFLIKDEEDFADAKRIKILLDRERVLIDLVINREKKKAAFALTAFRIAVQQSEESERAMRIAKRRIAQESG